MKRIDPNSATGRMIRSANASSGELARLKLDTAAACDATITAELTIPNDDIGDCGIGDWLDALEAFADEIAQRLIECECEARDVGGTLEANTAIATGSDAGVTFQFDIRIRATIDVPSLV